MSSGSYVYRPTYTEIAQMNIDRLNEKSRKLSLIYEQTKAQIKQVQQIIETAKNVDTDFEYTDVQTNLSGIISSKKNEVYSGVNTEDLLFADINVDTKEVLYVAIDFSDLISTSSAKNSTEYKKLKLASELTKKTMILPIDNDEQGKSINDFVKIMNEMLDDKSINFEFFYDYIIKRYNLVEKICSRASINSNNEEWSEYCALCALLGKRPQDSNVNLKEEIANLTNQLMKNNYLKTAKKALFETFEEIGLTIQGSYELEDACGKLYTLNENNCKAFVSEDEDSFIFEMVSDELTDNKSHHEFCSKRKAIAYIMEKKGFPVDIVSETDNFGANDENIYNTKENTVSNVDRLRARRTLQGKKGKARAIGG